VTRVDRVDSPPNGMVPVPFPTVTVRVVLPLLLATATTSAVVFFHLPDWCLGESHCDSSVDQLLGKCVYRKGTSLQGQPSSLNLAEMTSKTLQNCSVF